MEPNIKLLDAFEIELAEAAQQRSQAWRDIRAGKFTASENYKLMGEPRSKAAREAGEWSDTAMTYINTKVAEEMTGQVHQNSAAYPMVWGEDMEPLAKEHFTKVTGEEVRYSGFKMFNPHAGGSPDGFVWDALIEIKCPFNSANHIEYLKLLKGIEIKEAYPEYWWQMQTNMLFNDMDRCYFVAFDPRFPEKQKMKIVEVYKDVDDQMRFVKKLTLAIEEKLRLIKLLA
jgi:hypothetical protein